jgi:hypothetical protein
MNTNESLNGNSNKSKSPSNGAMSGSWDAGAQLKTIGDQIETIAKKLESQGKDAECDTLRDLGAKLSEVMGHEGHSKDDSREKRDGRESQSGRDSKSDSQPGYAGFDKKADAAKNKAPQGY